MSDFTFDCPICSQELKAPAEFAGQIIDCPSCGKSLTVPSPPTLRQSLPGNPPIPKPRKKEEYKVVPFVASITQKDGADKAAAQLQQLANSMSKDGWTYLRLESVETYVAAGSGCFGIGATPPRTISISMAVFRK